jgi:hypothetical protein
MPEVWFFRGKVVKRREKAFRNKSKVSVLFVSDSPGQAGEKVEVSQAEWQAGALPVFYEAGQRPSREELQQRAASM